MGVGGSGSPHGGVAQGVGQALFEDCVYDQETGQLLSDSGGRAYHMNSLWTAMFEGMGAVSDYLRPEKFPPIADLFRR